MRARARRPTPIVTDHMGTLDTASATVGDERSGVIGRVELGSTFPTITISPTTTDFNGNACLVWSAAIGDITLFLLKHVSVTAQLELRKKFAAIFACASGLLRLMGFLVCDRQQLHGNTRVWYLRLIDRRRSPTVTDRNRSYGNQAQLSAEAGLFLIFWRFHPQIVLKLFLFPNIIKQWISCPEQHM